MLENTAASSTARDKFFAEAEKLRVFADGLEGSVQQVCEEISAMKIAIPERTESPETSAKNHELETALFSLLLSEARGQPPAQQAE